LPENAAGRLHHGIWLLNNDLGYFANAPMPFVKAAVMLPALARVTGMPFREMLSSLKTPWGRALVVLALPAALALQVARFGGRAPHSAVAPAPSRAGSGP
jgi:hypothetical protein